MPLTNCIATYITGIQTFAHEFTILFMPDNSEACFTGRITKAVIRG